jgi:hypothetical protein
MSRYFFDFRQNGVLASDTVGCEFPDAERAYLEAFQAAQEMWTELLAQRRDPRRCCFEVHDGNGNLLFVLPFREILEACHDCPPTAPAIADTLRQSIVAMKQMRRAHDDLLSEVENARKVIRQSAKLIARQL